MLWVAKKHLSHCILIIAWSRLTRGIDMVAMVFLMVFLSGFSGLMYQVTWQKYLSIYLGSHALSTSLTLSSFFLFLALGYHFFGRYGHRLGSNRILSYAYLEGLVGVYAVLSPKLFSFLYEVWPSYPSNTAMHFISSGSFALILMGFPTFLMGGTIPLLTQGLSQSLSEGHRTHAWVYGLNTMGAFIGTMLAGFYFLETFGLAQSLNLTGIVNCLICVFLIVYCKVTGQKFQGYQPQDDADSQAKTIQWRLLSVAFLSGFLSFGLESMAIRMAGISLGSSNYTYTVIVGSFIIAIALGSFLATLSTDKNGLRWLLFTQVGLVFSLFCLYFLVPHWPNFFMRVRNLFATSEINFSPYWMLVFLSLFSFLVVPVLLMGTTLPLLFQQLKRQGAFLNETAGKMYAYNSVGATLGALILGYLAFFFLTAHEVFQVLVLVASLCCLLIFSIAIPSFRFIKSLGLFATFVVFIMILPHWSDYNFVPSRFYQVSQVPKTKRQYQEKMKAIEPVHVKKWLKILYSNFGVNTYTVVTESLKNDDRSLYVNGKPDASTGDRFTRTLTALIPLTLAKKNENIFIIGLGTGMSAGIAASIEGTKKVRVSEIAAGAIEAFSYFSKWNFGLENNLDRVEIVNDDAYKVLKNDEQKYDLIFSEPSNTWVSGVEKIYTEEFLKQAASKLKEDGLYSQWFPLFATTEASFQSILFNFKSAFEHVTLWSAGGGASIILASHHPIETSLEQLKDKSEKLAKIYESINRKNAVDILYHQVWTDAAVTDVARGATLAHTLYHPTLAYQSGRAFFASIAVNFEEMANKYFVYSDEELKLSQNNPVQQKIRSSGKDQLLWEEFQAHLTPEFYDKGIKLLLNHHTLVAGKLSLAKSYNFPDDKKVENDDKVLKQKVARNSQYHYLQDPKRKITPKVVDEKHPIANELFTRFLYLRSMREKAYLANVVAKVPEKCEANSDLCFENKLEILKFLAGKQAPQLAALQKGLFEKQSAAQQQVEKYFQQLVFAKYH